MAKRPTKARPRQKSPARPVATESTAIAILRPGDIKRARAELVQRLVEEGTNPASPANGGVPAGVLGEDAIIGMVGQFDIRLTDEEERVLAEAVNPDDVQIKPTGELYLSHEVYTRWFNRAFGRLRWALVPGARPRTNTKSVVVPYVLYVHGKPAATAWGEQEYHEENARQTLGDAVESTVASALRRVAKRIGVGLELWRKTWLEDFVYKNAIPVEVEVGYGERRKVVTQWRLKNQQPLKGELRPAGSNSGRGTWSRDDDRSEDQARSTRSSGSSSSRPPAGSDGNSALEITEKQHKRMWALVTKARRQADEVKAWIKSRFKVAHTRNVRRADYDYICEMIESPGPLPAEGED